MFRRRPQSQSRLGPRAPALVGELTWAGLDDVCVLVHGGAAVTARLALGGPPGGLAVGAGAHRPGHRPQRSHHRGRDLAVSRLHARMATPPEAA